MRQVGARPQLGATATAERRPEVHASVFPPLLQAGVQEDSLPAGGAHAHPAVRRSAAVCRHAALHERVFLLPGGSGLRPDRDLWSRDHQRM